MTVLPDSKKYPYLLESEIINLTRRQEKIRRHLLLHPHDQSARLGKEKLKQIMMERLAELWKRDFKHYREVYVTCERIKAEYRSGERLGETANER